MVCKRMVAFGYSWAVKDFLKSAYFDLAGVRRVSSHHLPRLALLFAGGVILVYLMNEIKMLLLLLLLLSFVFVFYFYLTRSSHTPRPF